MAIKHFTALLLFSFFILALRGQAVDSIASVHDSTSVQWVTVDTGAVKSLLLSPLNSKLITIENKSVVNDIEQYNPARKSIAIFILLMLMLGAITYLKTSFSKDLEELLQSVSNQNLAQQIFRAQSKEISFSSFLLNMNFVVSVSLYVQFILVHYYRVSSYESFSEIVFIIFLFTFFYLSKVVALKFIGGMFELSDECDEYIFNFTAMCKTVGLTLLPALFVFYTAPENFFGFVFAITVLMIILLVVIFVWRRLSTVYKLLYSGVYHFFLYVCVVEISPIFLLFKLLTKTIH